jgi:hypothetical protein
LQPAELRPGLIDTILATDKVVPYFDLSFQHASGPLLRRMRRFGDAESFLNIIDFIRSRCPEELCWLQIRHSDPFQTINLIKVDEQLLQQPEIS